MKISKTSMCCVLSALLVACSSGDRTADMSYSDWRHSLGMPTQIDMKPGGNTVITKEKKVEPVDTSVAQIGKTKGDYMTVMARQFRKDLISTGAQVKQQDSKILMRIPSQSVFGTNQAKIKPSFEPILKTMAENFKKHPETMVRIVGHTDNSDSVLNSKTLSLRQASAFSNFLRLEGVSAERLLAEGKGSLEPIANNDTPQGRLKNFYVEVIVYNLR
ncbi:MAG: OmpA family protein [Alphaproteobacteria bacterium]|nr:OmpA family protein [Alphaproteobacteria bacterium]